MARNPKLGWWVNASEWDAFVNYVNEEWGEEESYVRFVLQLAMREFVDRDRDLAEAEALLRDRLASRGLSSSTDSEDGDAFISDSETTKLGHRVNPDLKQRFAAHARENIDENPGTVLTRALRAHRDGGRHKRILDLAQTLSAGTTDETVENQNDSEFSSDGSSGSSVSTGSTNEDQNSSIDDLTPAGTTVGPAENPKEPAAGENLSTESSSGTTDTADENRNQADESENGSGGSGAGTTAASDENQNEVDGEVIIKESVVDRIASQLGPEFKIGELRDAVTAEVGHTEPVVNKYVAAVKDRKNVVKHPTVSMLFIPEEQRDDLDVYADMDRAEETEYLRDLLIRNTLEAGDTHTSIVVCSRRKDDIKSLFVDHTADSNGPSHTHAYDLAEEIDKESGFKYKDTASPKRVEMVLEDVPADTISAVAEEYGLSDKLNASDTETEADTEPASLRFANQSLEEQAATVRDHLVKNAVEAGEERHRADWQDIHEIAKEQEGRTVGIGKLYEIAEEVGNADGFEYHPDGDQKHVMLRLLDVEQAIVDRVQEQWDDVEMDQLHIDLDVTSWSAGTPAQPSPAAADDDD